MAISYEARMEGETLVITASGRDESVQEVIDYGNALIKLAVESGAKFLLCDERKLEYALDTFDTFQAAQTIAERAPKAARVAIVCSADSLEEARFWETVAVNRALQVRVDTDYQRAKDWLVRGGR